MCGRVLNRCCSLICVFLIVSCFALSMFVFCCLHGFVLCVCCVDRFDLWFVCVFLFSVKCFCVGVGLDVAAC